MRAGTRVHITSRGWAGERHHGRVVTGKVALRLKDGVGRRHGRDFERHVLVAFDDGLRSWVPVADLHTSRAVTDPSVLLPRARARVDNMEPADVRVLMLCARGRTLSPTDAHHASYMNERYGKILIQRHADRYQLTSYGKAMVDHLASKSVLHIFDPHPRPRSHSRSRP